MDRFFTYRVPDALTDQAALGQYWKVPWGKGSRGAVPVAWRAESPADLEESAIRDLIEILEERPLLGESELELARWLREFYFGTWPIVLQTLVPGPILQACRKKSKPRKKATPESRLELETPPELSVPQEQVWNELQDGLDSAQTWLLHGVTGSGKTEIYLRACQAVLEQGKEVLVLVPEVSLTPQTQRRFIHRFGDRVSILHSGLTDAQRREQWWRIRQGQTPLVVGTRSAIFAPLSRLGLVVIDEEHDGSYKQNGDLRYHARQVAAWRARRDGATLLLGSATPCLESYALARDGRYRLLTLNERIHGQPMPAPMLVKGFGIPGMVVRELKAAKERGEQSVVLLNRRGFSRYLLCQDCGWVPQCSECSISLTFHKRSRSLRCHYCGASHPAPAECADCGSRHLDLPGQGTERVEADLVRQIPGLRVARLDRDTVGARASVFEEVYGAFGRHELDCLLGTQMVSKGLDFPLVTLVVVLEADSGLHMPDFRAAERTFALLTQVAGRAGRGELPGKVMMVCQKPDHALFPDLLAGRWDSFVQRELAERSEIMYPPYCRMLRILISDENEEKTEKVALEMGEALMDASLSQGRVTVIGPAPCPLERLQSRYRWHILLKAPLVQDLQTVVRKALPNHDARGARVSIDPDPLELL